MTASAPSSTTCSGHEAYKAASKVDKEINAFIEQYPCNAQNFSAWATFIRTVESSLNIMRDGLLEKSGVLKDENVKLYRRLKGEGF